jgi:hypothetical protein
MLSDLLLQEEQIKIKKRIDALETLATEYGNTPKGFTYQVSAVVNKAIIKIGLQIKAERYQNELDDITYL